MRAIRSKRIETPQKDRRADRELGKANIKSKQRVQDHGEVLTPQHIVGAMLDLVKPETEHIDSRFLEPAYGTGNCCPFPSLIHPHLLRSRVKATRLCIGHKKWREPCLRKRTHPIDFCENRDKAWLNISRVGLVKPQNYSDHERKTYTQHPKPVLANRAKDASFGIYSISLRYYVSIDPRTIIESVHNDYNLSPSHYVSTNCREEILSREKALVRLEEAEEERAEAERALREVLRQITIAQERME